MEVEADGWTTKGGFTEAFFPGEDVPLPTKIEAFVMQTDVKMEFDVNQRGQVRIPRDAGPNWEDVEHVLFLKKKDGRLEFYPVRPE